MGPDLDANVDILIVGAGVTGIYQLYLAREATYVVLLICCGFMMLTLWWKLLLPRTMSLTLEEFAHFDRLADEEFEVKPVRFFSWIRGHEERP